MIGLIGIAVIFVMVFGGYLAAGGKMAIIMKSLPFEMMMIGGAAVGAFLIMLLIGRNPFGHGGHQGRPRQVDPLLGVLDALVVHVLQVLFVGQSVAVFHQGA